MNAKANDISTVERNIQTATHNLQERPLPVYPLQIFQTKLTVGAAGDAYEKEADTIADTVMRMPGGNTSSHAFKISPVIIQCEDDEEKNNGDNASTGRQDKLQQQLSEPDYLALKTPFLERNAYNQWNPQSAFGVWNYNLGFFKRFGLGDSMAGKAANLTAPFFINSQLKASNPNWWEITDKELNTTSIVGSVPLFTFDANFKNWKPLPFLQKKEETNQQILHTTENFIQRKCAACEKEEQDKIQKKEAGKSFIQAKSFRGGNAQAPAEIANQIESTRGRGNRLDSGTESFMSGSFQTDFSQVNIHTNADAYKMNRQLNSKAFTVGNDIYFNEGQYKPSTPEGQHLLAHELTHTIQQSGSNNIIRKRSYYTEVTAAFGTPATNYAAVYTLLSPLNETDILDTLLDMHRYSGTAIQGLVSNIGLATGPVGTDRLLAYFLGAKNALLQNSMTATDLTSLTRTMSILPLAQQTAINNFISAHRTTATRDLYSGASLPSAARRARVETIFNPGATTTTSSTGVITTTMPTPDPVCSNPAAFTTRIRTSLVPQITAGATEFRTRRAAGPNFPLASARSMADLAQTETEDYFRPYLARASRSGAAGSYSLGGSIRASGLLADQSTTTRWQTTSGRMAWLRYWFNHQTGNMNDTLFCDDSQIDAALTAMATDAALISDIDDYVNSWPAEATGGINIQPYLDATQLVCQRWDTFTTIIHEFIHILAHPNFRSVGGQLPNNAMELLKEGMDDVLRKELWEGAGRLRATLISHRRNADRATIEGGSFPLDTSKVCSHPYYGSLSDAERVATLVGRENVKLAYFLGQTEYLGIGNGTTTSSGAPVTGSFYNTADLADQNVIPVIPGETRAALLMRTNGREVRDLSNSVIAASSSLPASVRVPGVRKVYVHADDSLISIAVQNGITPYEIIRANNMTTTSVTVGTRLIIPRH